MLALPLRPSNMHPLENTTALANLRFATDRSAPWTRHVTTNITRTNDRDNHDNDTMDMINDSVLAEDAIIDHYQHS